MSTTEQPEPARTDAERRAASRDTTSPEEGLRRVVAIQGPALTTNSALRGLQWLTGLSFALGLILVIAGAANMNVQTDFIGPVSDPGLPWLITGAGLLNLGTVAAIALLIVTAVRWRASEQAEPVRPAITSASLMNPTFVTAEDRAAYVMKVAQSISGSFPNRVVPRQKVAALLFVYNAYPDPASAATDIAALTAQGLLGTNQNTTP